MWYHLEKASDAIRKVAIIGTGPTGLTLARNILNENIPALHLDFIDRLPVPYGLIRYGVAPDHQDIKDCANRPEQKLDQYNAKSSHPYAFKQVFRFIGNTKIIDHVPDQQMNWLNEN